MLVCRDVTEMTTDYLEHALPWRSRLAMKWHLAICSFCRRHLRQLRQTTQLLGDMPHPPVPAALEDRLVAEAALAGIDRRADPPPI